MVDPLRLPEMSHDLAATVEPPAFETVVERAGSRRRRRGAGAALGTALVVAAVVGTVAWSGSLRAGRDPAGPVAPPSASPTAGPGPALGRSVLISYSVAADGSVIGVWQRCTHGETRCVTTWRLTTDSGVRSGHVRGAVPVTAYAAGTDFVVTSWQRLGVVVHRDGSTTPLHRVASLAPSDGDVLVRTGKGIAVVDPVTGALASAPLPPGAVDLVLAAVSGASMYALPARSGPGPVSVAVLRDGHWSEEVLSSGRTDGNVPGALAVSGAHAAALASYDGATILPVGVLGVTSDAGRTWTKLPASAFPFATVDSMAATSDGTLYVATAGGERLYRSTGPGWTRFVRVPAPRGIGDLENAGARVVGRAGTARSPVLLSFDRSGPIGDPIPMR